MKEKKQTGNSRQKQQVIKSNHQAASLQMKKNYSLRLSLFIVFCVPFLLYFQTVSYGYAGFDDDLILANNSQFFSHVSNIGKAFSTDALTTKQSLFYRPVQTISFLIDEFISGAGKTWMFHFSNVLLAGFIACALFLLLMQCKIPQKFAMVAAILYCVHPLFVSSIAWIPARGDLQLTLCTLLALYFYIEYHQKGKMLHLFLHFVLFTIALFCKETAAMLPVLFAMYIICFTDKKLFDKKNVVHFVMYAVIGAEWFWMRSKAIVAVAKQEDEVGFSSMYSMIKTIPESLCKFFLPFNIAPIPSFSMLKIALGILLIALLVVVFILSKTSSSKSKMFFIGWFLLFIVPTLFFKHTLIDYLDHRFLLPLIGIYIFALTSIPQTWMCQLEHKKIWIVILITGCLACNTFIKMQAYASSTTFYNEALAKNDESCLIYYNRGCMNINNGGPIGQIEEYTKALALAPNYYLVYLNRGAAYSDAKMFDKAVADYSKAIELRPNDARGYYNRGYTYRQMNSHDKALIDYSKAIAIDSTFYRAVISRGNTYAFYNEYDKAIADFTRAISLHPDSVNPYYFRGIIYEQLKEHDNAISDYTKAISINPTNSEFYFNRGNIFNSKGKSDNAIEDYSHAIALNPNYGNALNNRANTYYLKGMKDLACKDFERAEKLGIAAAQSNRLKLCQ